MFETVHPIPYPHKVKGETNSMKKALCIVVAVMILVLGITPAFAINHKNVKKGQTLYVNISKGTLKMYNAFYVEAPVILKLQNGSPVTATGNYNGGFLEVTYSVGSTRETGWVLIKYLSANKPSASTNKTSNTNKTNNSAPAQKETVASLNFKSYKLIPDDTTYVVSSKPSRAGGFVNLRWVPSLDSAIIERMYKGEEMTVIAEGKKWLQVQCNDGYVGFIVKSFTEDVFRGKTTDWEAMQAAAQAEQVAQAEQ